MFLPAAPVETQAPAILALAALLILLGLLSTALLGHLLCFHIYLSKCLLQARLKGDRLQGGTFLGCRTLKSWTLPVLALCGCWICPTAQYICDRDVNLVPAALPFEFWGTSPLLTSLFPRPPVWHKLTTYEYIVQHRPAQEAKETHKELESCPRKMRSIQV